MAPKELKALILLMDHREGLFGSELVGLSDGYLSRGTVYTLLERLVQKGYVTEQDVPATTSYQIARTKHHITGAGQKAVHDYLNVMNLYRAPSLTSGGVPS